MGKRERREERRWRGGARAAGCTPAIPVRLARLHGSAARGPGSAAAGAWRAGREEAAPRRCVRRRPRCRGVTRPEAYHDVGAPVEAAVAPRAQHARHAQPAAVPQHGWLARRVHSQRVGRRGGAASGQRSCASVHTFVKRGCRGGGGGAYSADSRDRSSRESSAHCTASAADANDAGRCLSASIVRGNDATAVPCRGERALVSVASWACWEDRGTHGKGD